MYKDPNKELIELREQNKKLLNEKSLYLGLNQKLINKNEMLEDKVFKCLDIIENLSNLLEEK